MTTTDQATTTARTTSRTLHARRLLMTLLVAVVGVVGLNLSPASALSSPSASGAYGGVTPRGVQGTSTYYKEPTALYGSMVPAVNITGGTVTRSLATSGAQRVEHRFAVYQWINGGWVAVYSSPTYVKAIPQGYSSVVLDPAAVRIASGNYFRVTFSLTWRDAYGTYLGARNFDYNAAGDYRCLVGGCVVGAGWMYL